MPDMPPSALDWAADKTRFAADRLSRDHGFPLGPLAQQFATLTYSLLDAETVAGVLDQVVGAALRLVPGAELVSITLRAPDGRFHTPVHTDAVAAELDQVQYDLGEGPCLDAAMASGPAVAVSQDLAVEPEWPRFGPAAAQRGVGAVLSTALLPDAEPPRLSGALNVYSRTPHGLDEADQAVTLLLATHASLALAHTQAIEAAQLEVSQLRRAVDSRDVIGQAKGVLMGRRGMSADDAFDLLRRTSQTLNVKLVELAETVAGHHAELNLPDEPDR
ncbi:GAF and ANTAR domain-containing protein [Actinosynnema sp. NPDC050436]|uniref:GAF and ANTAR domain-containing protein n=1 Tax=Actinosynnema sp. NPDC050436 TaxID=3155659 RepID=UPI0034012A44